MKLDKQEVRERDMFLKFSDRFSNWIAKNRTGVLSVLTVTVLGSCAYVGYLVYTNSREDKAQTALYEARKKFDPSLTNPFQDRKEPLEPKLTDDSANAFNTVINDFKGTQASLVAAIELSQAYLNERKADLALKVFENASTSPKDIVSSLFVLQNAKVLEANGKCSEAVSLLEKVWNSKKVLKTLHTEARLRAGICYEQLSQHDKAKEMFTTASQDKGAAADAAKKYLRLLTGNAG